jgi:predicted RNA-binding protein
MFAVTSENWKISVEKSLWGLAQRHRSVTRKVVKGGILLLL